MNEEFKVGERVEWCLGGDFGKYENSNDEWQHDFGTVTKVEADLERVWARWDRGESDSSALTKNIRKVITKPEIKVLEWTRASLNNASDKRLVELTEAELQFIVSVLKKEIGIAQIQIWSSKKECARLYEVSDPNEPASFFHFEELKKRRNALRYWKSINKKLSAIQAKLKRTR